MVGVFKYFPLPQPELKQQQQQKQTIENIHCSKWLDYSCCHSKKRFFILRISQECVAFCAMQHLCFIPHQKSIHIQKEFQFLSCQSLAY